MRCTCRMKIMPLRFAVPKVVALQISLANYRDIELWQNSFGFHLQLPPLKTHSNDESGRETTLYSHSLQMQGLFLDSVRFFQCLISAVLGVNLSLKAKVSFVTLQNLSRLLEVNHIPNKALKRKCFTNFYVPVLI